MYTGSKYERTKDLGIVEIAKLIRKDLAPLVKKHNLKLSITTSKYSMGQSLTVRIKECPGLQVWNPARVQYEAISPRPIPYQPPTFLSPEAHKIIMEIEETIEAYNYDASDPLTDYYNCKFYKNVCFDGKLEQESREELERSRTMVDRKKPVSYGLASPVSIGNMPPDVDEFVSFFQDVPEDLVDNHLKSRGWCVSERVTLDNFWVRKGNKEVLINLGGGPRNCNRSANSVQWRQIFIA